MRMLPVTRRGVTQSELAVPRGAAPVMGARYDADAFGRLSEAIARFLGTGKFIVGQTIVLSSVAILVVGKH